VCIKSLVRAYFELDGHQNLIVRVAGYSDYFNNLNKNLQDEIILRTEQSDLQL